LGNNRIRKREEEEEEENKLISKDSTNLNCGTRSEITGPITMRTISIREHIIRFDIPS
jgi:hypothetical protein